MAGKTYIILIGKVGQIYSYFDENQWHKKYNDTILKLLDTALKLKSTFAQGHSSGRNWMLFKWKWMKNVWKTLGKPILTSVISELVLIARFSFQSWSFFFLFF